MTETRNQSLLEMNRRLDEVSRQTEEQSQALRNELKNDLQKEISGLKDFFQSFMRHLQPPFDPSSSQTPPLDSPTQQHLTTPGLLDTTRPPPLPGGRIPRIDFPKFDGTMLKEWVSLCEQFFSLDGTQPEFKVRIASLHLVDKALQWHQNYMRNRFDQYPNWRDYVTALSTRFGKLYDDPLADLVSLKQANDTVEDFLDKFECALTCLVLPPEHALNIFLTNLNPYLALHTRQFNPQSVAEAARIARLHESALQLGPPKSPEFPSIQRQTIPNPGLTTPPLYFQHLPYLNTLQTKLPLSHIQPHNYLTNLHAFSIMRKCKKERQKDYACFAKNLTHLVTN